MTPDLLFLYASPSTNHKGVIAGHPISSPLLSSLLRSICLSNQTDSSPLHTPPSRRLLHPQWISQTYRPSPSSSPSPLRPPPRTTLPAYRSKLVTTTTAWFKQWFVGCLGISRLTSLRISICIPCLPPSRSPVLLLPISALSLLAPFKLPAIIRVILATSVLE